MQGRSARCVQVVGGLTLGRTESFAIFNGDTRGTGIPISPNAAIGNETDSDPTCWH